MPFPAEAVKELVFGGAVGLCVGVVAKRVNVGLDVGVVGGIAATLFVLFRGAIFDGKIRAACCVFLVLKINIFNACFKARSDGLPKTLVGKNFMCFTFPKQSNQPCSVLCSKLRRSENVSKFRVT